MTVLVSIIWFWTRESDTTAKMVKNFLGGVIAPRGALSGYPGVPSAVIFEKIQIEKETSWFFVSYSKIKNMCIDLLNTEKKRLVGLFFSFLPFSGYFWVKMRKMARQAILFIFLKHLGGLYTSFLCFNMMQKAMKFLFQFEFFQISPY